MIPKNITSEHINKAIHEIEINGVPKNRKSHKYSLVSKGNHYPPKYVVALANKYANGRVLDSSEFNGGVETNDFLKELGFKVLSIIYPDSTEEGANWLHIVRRKREQRESINRKKTLLALLEERFGIIETEVSFNWLIVPDWNSMDPDIRRIADELVSYRNHKHFLSPGRHLQVDYFVPSQNMVIEYDERQHFTIPRAIALSNYPAGLDLAFNVETWIATCEIERAVDHNPIYRDEQRAFYDSLRDILAARNSMTMLRINDKDYDWTKADAKNELAKLLSANIKTRFTICSTIKDEHGIPNKQENWFETISACYCNLQQEYRKWAHQFSNHQEVKEWCVENNINKELTPKPRERFNLRSSYWNSITIPVLEKVAPLQLKELEIVFKDLFKTQTVKSEEAWYLLFFIHPGRHEMWHFDDHFPNGYSYRLAKLLRSHRLGLKGLKKYLSKTDTTSLSDGYSKGCAKVAFRHIHLHPDTSLWEKPHMNDTKEVIRRLKIGVGDITSEEKYAAVALSRKSSFGFDAWLKNYAQCAINEGPLFFLKQGEYISDCFKEIVEILQQGEANQSDLKAILCRYHKIEE